MHGDFWGKKRRIPLGRAELQVTNSLASSSYARQGSLPWTLACTQKSEHEKKGCRISDNGTSGLRRSLAIRRLALRTRPIPVPWHAPWSRYFWRALFFLTEVLWHSHWRLHYLVYTFLFFPFFPLHTYYPGAERQEGRDPDMMHIRRRDEIERGAWDKRIFSFFSSSTIIFFRLREVAMRALTSITLLCFYFFVVGALRYRLRESSLF